MLIYIMASSVVFGLKYFATFGYKVHPSFKSGESVCQESHFCFLFPFNNKTLNMPHDTTCLYGKQCKDLCHTWL